MRAAATALQEAAGDAGIDYLVRPLAIAVIIIHSQLHRLCPKMVCQREPSTTMRMGEGKSTSIFKCWLIGFLSCDRSFAVQAVSRFALAYFLTTGGGLATNATVMSICNQGQTLDDLSVDDLSLKDRLSTLSQTSMFLSQSKRDSTVLDSIHEVRSSSFPV